MRTRTRKEERPTVTRVGFAPIVRVDAARREIELCATSEAVDAHGTVFAYAASRDAFARWAGNVREMHERKAVGRRVAVRCDDEARKVYVRVRISRGAEDTWQKVLDGTLRGASIGAANVVWRHQRGVGASTERPEGADSPDIPVATRYDLVELSLVDLPSNPDALGVTFVRDGVPVAELLDDVEDESDEEKQTRLGDAQDRLPLDMLSTAADRGAPDDAAEAIAAAALARGRADVAAQSHGQPATTSGAASGQEAKRTRLASLGAPGYVAAIPAINGRGTDGGVNAVSETVHGSDRTPIVYDRDTRARGPFSTNPDGAPDMGVPARAEERPTVVGASGGRPAHGDSHTDASGDTSSSGDGSDREAAFHGAARSLLHACGCPACQMALAALDGDAGYDDDDDAEDGDADAGETRAGGVRSIHSARSPNATTDRLARALNAHTRQLNASIGAVYEGMREGVGQLGALLGRIERRVAVIEEQPLPGGPQLRVADKTHALLPGGGGGQPGAGEQLRALEALAGRLSDPQAQIAVATEMIRLQQEAAGLAPDRQAMPRAGLGGY